MKKEELLLYYFGKGTSGTTIDGHKEHYIRINPTLITKNKQTEFEYVMDILIPEWRKDKELMEGKRDFIIERIAYDEEEVLCICTQPIKEICYIKHTTLDKSVQVGNHCVGKIREDLEKEAKQLQRIRKKEAEQLKERKLDKERDELVARVEREHDLFVLRQFFRECRTCQNLTIIKDEPIWKVDCKNCYKKK
jgi:hypothetical protein